MALLKPGLTTILYDNSTLAQLEGAVSLPMESRVQIGKTDYIIHNVRVQIRETDYDIYYDTHMAEETGTQPPIV
jgi:hypothetical protein